MNILIVHCKYRIRGGEDVVVENDMKLLKEMGHKVVPYILSNASLDGAGIFTRIGCVIEYLDPKRQKQKLIGIIKKERIDRIWVHNTLWLTGSAAYEAGLLCHVPVIQTVHNYRFLCPNGICYRKNTICCDCLRNGMHNAVFHGCYRGSRVLSAVIAATLMRQRRSGIYGRMKFVCLSEFQREMLINYLPEIDANKVFIKHNATVLSDKRIPYGQRRNQFIYAGRLTESKGVKELLKAWRIIENTQGDSAPYLIICGAGELADHVRDYIEKHSLHYVNYVGEIPHDKVLSYMAESKALIYPTKWFEGEPMAMIEAYSVGTPVIASDIGGVSELIEEGHTGRKLDHKRAIGHMVDIIKKWGNSYHYDGASIRCLAEQFSQKQGINAIKAIL